MWLKAKIILLFVFSFGLAYPQQDSIDSVQKKSKRFQLNGYVKDMRIVSFDNSGNSVINSFIHNRLKFKYDFNTNWSARAEMRTRLFYGNGFEYKSLSKILNKDEGIIDLNFVPIKDKSILWSSQIDRLSFNYSKGNWEITAGRQRINWGVNLVWNPNDLFNTLNFTDFDYEERPGSDALRIQYYSGMKSLEFAYRPAKDFEKSIIAGLLKTNFKGYDFQALASYYKGEIAIGGAWAGNISVLGFKGESTWFGGNNNNKALIMVSPSLDYTFKNGMYAVASFLYKSEKSDLTTLFSNNTTVASGNLDVKSLMPNKYSYFVQASGAISPLLSASGAVIYASDMRALFAMPSISWSVKQNLELLLLAQTYFANINNKFTSLGNGVFVRFKWSF